MELFIEKFREEVKDYFERLETGLLLLEKNPENYQVIDEVFRIMHSMKGSGGMFGFDLLSYVTHDLESLFELFRSKKHRIDSETISFTLHVIDGLHKLMILEPTEEHKLLSEKIKSDTQKQIGRITGIPLLPEIPTEQSVEILGEPDQITYYISFVPDENIMNNGTNPLYLIDELNALGECNIQVSFEKLPKLAAIDPGKCYAYWDIFISTPEAIETLHDVFIFVNDISKIEIEKVFTGNVIHNEKILAGFLNARENQIPWDTNAIEKEPPGLSEKDPESVVKTGIQKAVTGPSKVDSIRVGSQKIDQYMNLVSELITTQSWLEEINSAFRNEELEAVTETLGKLSRQLRDNAFDMSLIPLQSVAVRFDRLIHDLSKELGKEVNLVTGGMETEIDKNIIEKLVDPLLHIIRNSIDHGIESKNMRLDRGKDGSGTLSIRASTIGSFVQIDIEDDGEGLDAVAIRNKAISQGIISGEEDLTDNEIYKLIFMPGVTTSETVTGISGRGVGLDVVWKRITEMRGSVELASEKGRFTRFTIKLPLSLSIIDGLLFKIGDGFYVIPSAAIHKIFSSASKQLNMGKTNFVRFENEELPFVNLHEAFRLEKTLPVEQFVVVVNFENKLFGLVVDEVIREYQAVIKPIGRLLEAQDIFAGASILGTGQLALVLNTNKLIKKYSV
ncbi:MAG: chemotaxis protein CheA [Prolixibacteraceae bacterium]|jgi:two-component system chemotaxis sensor kinase CheA